MESNSDFIEELKNNDAIVDYNFYYEQNFDLLRSILKFSIKSRSELIGFVATACILMTNLDQKCWIKIDSIMI